METASTHKALHQELQHHDVIHCIIVTSCVLTDSPPPLPSIKFLSAPPCPRKLSLEGCQKAGGVALTNRQGCNDLYCIAALRWMIQPCYLCPMTLILTSSIPPPIHVSVLLVLSCLLTPPLSSWPLPSGGKTPDAQKRTFADVMIDRDLKREEVRWFTP